MNSDDRVNGISENKLLNSGNISWIFFLIHDIFGFRIFLRAICFKCHSILTSFKKNIQENVTLIEQFVFGNSMKSII